MYWTPFILEKEIFLDKALILDPDEIRISITSKWPFLMAQWSGESPSLVLISILAPLLKRCLTIAKWPLIAA